jgi:hypothetical protein
MTAFTPWAWPAAIAGGYTGIPDDSLAANDESIEADRSAHPDVSGYHVEAADGRIGTIDRATYNVGSSHVVVDTGPWIFGHTVLLPAGTVERVDHDNRTVYVNRTKEQIKSAPEYDPDPDRHDDYLARVGRYYEDTYRVSPPVL